jgi:transcription antitermination factor NusG|tara:strand:+ start:1318 stop:1560 length:243 start_codon:yes stop_codon:yes gene_type:complete
MNKNLENLHLMSFKELQELKGQIETMMSMKQPSMRVGQKVTIDHAKFSGVQGVIEKVNRLKCKVRLNGSTFNVPKSMILI